MRKWKWFIVNGWECNSPFFIVTQLLSSSWINATMCQENVLQNTRSSLEFNVAMTHLIVMTQETLLVELPSHMLLIFVEIFVWRKIPPGWRIHEFLRALANSPNIYGRQKSVRRKMKIKIKHTLDFKFTFSASLPVFGTEKVDIDVASSRHPGTAVLTLRRASTRSVNEQTKGLHRCARSGWTRFLLRTQPRPQTRKPWNLNAFRCPITEVRELMPERTRQGTQKAEVGAKTQPQLGNTVEPLITDTLINGHLQ